ncbi:MAG: methylated-DNA--[protein]-cysteine S-methyltransferase [Aeromicrobium sp.]
MTTRWMDSPIGGLRLHADGDKLVAIDFDSTVEGERVKSDILDTAEKQLTEYFAGERTEFDLPLAAQGTGFQHRVWEELVKVPFGETASYGEISHRLGLDRRGPRAVGTANGRNPIPIIVPCHRIIGADGTLIGYAGGLDRKVKLLNLETPGLF